MYLRLALTVILLYLVYSTIDKKVLVTSIQNSRGIYLVIGVFVFILSNITGGLQWFFLLRSQKLRIKLSRVMRFYLLGAFFNNFMPGNIGGDVVKSFKMIKEKSNAEIVISSIVWDRVVSFIILYFFSLVSGFILFGRLLFLYLLGFSILLMFVLSRFILKGRLGASLLKWVKKIPHNNIRTFAHDFLKSFKKYIMASKGIIYFYCLSCLTQFLKIFIQVLVSLSFNYGISLTEIYFFIPIIGIVSALPVSINGIGFREFLGKYFSMLINKNAAIISFFLSVGNIIIMLGNLPGVVFMLRIKKITNRAKSERT